MQVYGLGKIEKGDWKGRRFLIPTKVLVEKQGIGGKVFAKACINCCKLLSDQEWETHKCDE